MNRTITVDARMLLSSGIGVVLRKLLQRAINQRPEWKFRLLGQPDSFNRFSWTKARNVECFEFTAPIHSLSEQFHWPTNKARGSQLVIAGNYNIPLKWAGPLLTLVYDMAHVALPEIFGGVTKQMYARTMFRQVRRRSTGIVFISEFTKSEFQKYVGEFVADSAVVPLGVDDEWFSIPQQTTPFPPTIVFVGNVKPHKNLRRLLEAFESIRNEIPHTLVLIGRKEGFITGDNSLEQLVQRSEGRVVLTGEISDVALMEQIARATALVLPSLYEGFGLPPVEAMAASCPTLVANSSSLPEVCGEASLYCDPTDASDIARQLKRIATDCTLQAALRTKGVAKARTYSWDTSSAKFIALLDVLLS